MDTRIDLTEQRDFRHRRTIVHDIDDEVYPLNIERYRATHRWVNVFGISGHVDERDYVFCLFDGDEGRDGYCACCGRRLIPWNPVYGIVYGLCPQCDKSDEGENTLPWYMYMTHAFFGPIDDKGSNLFSLR